jgi:hypothetical protein
MPLHDWMDLPGWDGVHLLWIAELLHWIKPRLPEGYRAFVGTMPTMAVGAPAELPDVGVRQGTAQRLVPEVLYPRSESDASGEAPEEEVAVAVLDPTKALFIERRGFLIAAVELVSPRNKDRPDARATYTARYTGYLLAGVHLLLIDIQQRPLNFSFADRIAAELQMPSKPLPPPMAITYRVGEPAATGGRLLGIWRYPLTVGNKLPTVRLPLTTSLSVPVDLEETYRRAAEDAYLT